MTEPGEKCPQRRGILVLMEKNLGRKISRIEELNYNLVRIRLEHTIMKMTIFGVYGYRQEFFLD